MTNPTPGFYLIFALTALIIGMGKGGFGSSFAALATPLLALTMPVPELVPLMLPFLMVGDLFAVGFHWRRWDRRQVLLLIPGALVGVAIGTLFLTNVSPDVLRTFLAILDPVVCPLPGAGAAHHAFLPLPAAAVARADRRRRVGLLLGHRQHRRSPGHHLPADAELPAAGLYRHHRAVLHDLNYIKIPFYYAAGLFDLARIVNVAWLLPLVPVGVWLGRMFVVRVSQRTFEAVILIFLVISALLLLLT